MPSGFGLIYPTTTTTTTPSLPPPPPPAPAPTPLPPPPTSLPPPPAPPLSYPNLPALPPYVPPAQSNDIGRSSRTTQQVLAPTTALPITYGRDRIEGGIAVVHIDDTNGFMYLAVAFGEPITEFQQVYVDSINVNDPTNGLLSYTGAAIELHVDGGASALLAAAISGYTDAPTAAYVVIKIPKEYARGFPKVEAIIQGVRVYDPRTTNTAWSSNPVLAFRDLAVRAGHEIDETSAIDGANFCDEEVGGSGVAFRRRRIGLTLAEPRSIEDWAKVFRTYTGCFIVWEGGKIRFIPDRAQTLPGDITQHFTTDDIMEGTFRAYRRGAKAFPNVVIVEYRESAADDEWRTLRAVYELPGFTEQRIQRLNMPGIHHYAQAYREAKERALKILNDLTFEFTVTDIGVELQVGSLLSFTYPLGFTDKVARVMSLGNDAGRWRITCEAYTVDAYSNDAPATPAAYISELGSPDSPVTTPATVVQQLTIGQTLSILGGLGEPTPTVLLGYFPLSGNTAGVLYVDAQAEAAADASIDLSTTSYPSALVTVDGVAIAVVPDTQTKIYRSIDNGLNWTLVYTHSDGTAFPNIAANGTRLVAVGDNGVPLVSTNGGTSWSAQTAIADFGANDITFGAGLFVVIGANDISGLPEVYTSLDGVTWTERTLPGSAEQLDAIVYGGGYFLSIDTQDVNYRAVYSTNAVNWNIADTGIAVTLSTVESKNIAFNSDLGYWLFNERDRVLTTKGAASPANPSSTWTTFAWPAGTADGGNQVAVIYSPGFGSIYTMQATDGSDVVYSNSDDTTGNWNFVVEVDVSSSGFFMGCLVSGCVIQEVAKLQGPACTDGPPFAPSLITHDFGTANPDHVIMTFTYDEADVLTEAVQFREDGIYVNPQQVVPAVWTKLGVETAVAGINNQTGTAYTAQLADAGKVIRMSNASANVVTIPANSTTPFPLNSVIGVRWHGVGATSISAAGGVTINRPDSLNLRERYSECALRKVGTDEWDLAGDMAP